MSNEIVLLTVTGNDRPGLMALITRALADCGADVLDIGQAVIHDRLALGLLINAGADGERGLSRVVEECAAAGVQASFEPVSEARYQDWASESGVARHILTLLTNGPTSRALAEVSALTRAEALNIETVRRLSDRVPLRRVRTPGRSCLELRMRGTADAAARLTGALLDTSAELGFDFSVQQDSVFRRNRRLVAFDMDSTLIDAEVINELAKLHGVGEQVAAITESAMRGEIDFQQSLRRRVALLNGLEAHALDSVAERVALNPGAHRLLDALTRFGYRTAIISGGFTHVGDRLQKRLGIHEVHANRLVVRDGVITGELAGDIIDAARKAELLSEIAGRHGIHLAQTIAVGDGANDLPMLKRAGLGVAFHAKPLVKATARHAISHFGLDAVLYLIGFSDADIAEVLANEPG